MKNSKLVKASVGILLLLSDTSQGLKLVNNEQTHAKFITDDLKDLVAKGPELGALQNKMKRLEVIAPRIVDARADVIELLKPLPKPDPVVVPVHITCSPPTLVVGCTAPEPAHTVIVEEAACPSADCATPTHSHELVHAIHEASVESQGPQVIEIEAPRHPVEVLKEVAVKAIDQSVESSGDAKETIIVAADHAEESGPPAGGEAGEEEAGGPVLNVNTKIKHIAIQEEQSLTAKEKVIKKDKKNKKKVAAEESQSVDDLTDNALKIPTEDAEEPKIAKDSLKEKVQKVAKKEAAKSAVKKEEKAERKEKIAANEATKTSEGDTKMDGIDLEKRVKESLNKKAIVSTARETEKQPSGKAAKEANDDKEEAKAAEPVAKEDKKTPRKESTQSPEEEMGELSSLAKRALRKYESAEQKAVRTTAGDQRELDKEQRKEEVKEEDKAQSDKIKEAVVDKLADMNATTDAKQLEKRLVKFEEIKKQEKIVVGQLEAKKSLQKMEKAKKVDKSSDLEKAYLEAKKKILGSPELKAKKTGLDAMVKQETAVNALKETVKMEDKIEENAEEKDSAKAIGEKVAKKMEKAIEKNEESSAKVKDQLEEKATLDVKATASKAIEAEAEAEAEAKPKLIKAEAEIEPQASKQSSKSVSTEDEKEIKDIVSNQVKEMNDNNDQPQSLGDSRGSELAKEISDKISEQVVTKVVPKQPQALAVVDESKDDALKQYEMRLSI